jgi:membrane-associated phospholipid phosphatase
MWSWQLITRFGETSLLLPCAVILYVWLRGSGETVNARKWMLLFVIAAGATLGSKLAFMGWGIGLPELDFTGFSGHSMMASAVLPVLFHRMVPGNRPRCALAAAGGGTVVALFVGLSRLALDAHSLSEVLGGLALGLAASLTFLGWSANRARDATPAVGTAVVLAIVLALPATGATAPTQDWIEQLAVYLSGRDKPFRREDWSIVGTRQRAATAAHALRTIAHRPSYRT